MAKGINSINLLRGQEHILDKFVDWALTIGRLLVIVTETAALAVFFMRFDIDSKLVDLHDLIKPKQAIVSSTYYKDKEATYRDLQQRLAIIKKLNNKGAQTLAVYQDIVDLARGKVTFNSITQSNNTITLDANTRSVTQLTGFVDALKNYPEVQSINVNKVENKTSNAVIAVNITVTLKTN